MLKSDSRMMMMDASRVCENSWSSRLGELRQKATSRAGCIIAKLARSCVQFEGRAPQLCLILGTAAAFLFQHAGWEDERNPELGFAAAAVGSGSIAWQDMDRIVYSHQPLLSLGFRTALRKCALMCLWCRQTNRRRRRPLLYTDTAQKRKAFFFINYSRPILRAK